jgi:hypothetical protein
MKTQITDFTFKFSGHGHYQVTYKSPKTSKQHTVTTTDMQLIDKTKNADYPKQKDLSELKRVCKPKQWH